MIKGIFFDFDGVITVEKMGSPTIISYIAKKIDRSYEQVEEAYRKHNNRLLSGEITHRDMWDTFCNDLQTDIDYNILTASFLNVTLDEGLINYIKELKESYIIGMITDNKSDRIRTILNHTVLGSLFDVVIISAEVQGRKTDRKIFKRTLEEANLASTECVFIDNTEENLVVPQKMGFQTILFDDEARDLLKFKEILQAILGSI